MVSPQEGHIEPASSRANGDALTAAAQHPSHALALLAVVYGILLPARKSGRWQSGSDREGHYADTTKLCWFCVLRNLRGHGVRCERCVGRRRCFAPPVTPGLTRKMLSQMDGPMPGYVTLNMEVEIEAGTVVPRHTHPGIESSYVLEGGFELPVQGQPTRTLKAGDGFQIPPETPHAGGKPGDKKTRIAITYVVEKGKPLVSPA
jgi:quercetin dioxygenase-like cupin family protein